jgi:hypothetical protein
MIFKLEKMQKKEDTWKTKKETSKLKKKEAK